MSTLSFSAYLPDLELSWPRPVFPRSSQRHPGLSDLASQDESRLPGFVRDSAVAMKYLRLLGPLAWERFPDRPDLRFDPHCPPLPYAPFVAAYLVKLDQHLPFVADLRQYLVEHPALAWVLGFPLIRSRHYPGGFDADASLPTHRHMSRLLRSLPNACLQFLLDDTVRLLDTELRDITPSFGECIALDTKHIIAWVKENNPKAYIEAGRYDKTRQPPGDPDCRLGCKRKHNQAKRQESVEASPVTPLTNPVPAAGLRIGEYYWGYGSGIAVTKVCDWGEFVLAELTQPFDQPDVSYFYPLLADVERRLGCRPKYGAFDAAFDAFYVYEYFASAGGFAAVPLTQRGGHAKRVFSPDGLPLCEAGLPMPLKYTFNCRTTLIEHERGKYVCPLRYPTLTGESCPINHQHWAKLGCVSTLATSPGARLRYQIDRDSEEYKRIYKQRTATERINSQAVELGIERPKLRNAASIANHNSLIYVLINVHALQRVRQHLAECSG